MSSSDELRHNHTDAWSCNSSCPAHPEHTDLMANADITCPCINTHTANVDGILVRICDKCGRYVVDVKSVLETKDYKIVSIRPPSNERELFPQYWLFNIEGPGHQDKTFVAPEQECGGQFIRALQAAYDAGVRTGGLCMLDSIRASILDYPNCGGDEVIMKKIEIIELAAELRGRETVIKSWENVGKGLV